MKRIDYIFEMYTYNTVTNCKLVVLMDGRIFVPGCGIDLHQYSAFYQCYIAN